MWGRCFFLLQNSFGGDKFASRNLKGNWGSYTASNFFLKKSLLCQEGFFNCYSILNILTMLTRLCQKESNSRENKLAYVHAHVCRLDKHANSRKKYTVYIAFFASIEFMCVALAETLSDAITAFFYPTSDVAVWGLVVRTLYKARPMVGEKHRIN